MERQEMLIRFADLRRLARAVPAYLAERAGEPAVPTLRAELEEELGVSGLDTEELILEFAETYRVDYTQFDFTGLISPEGASLGETLFFFPLAAYFLAGFLLRTALSALCWPLSHQFAKRVWQYQLPVFWIPAADSQRNPLTIGDFVASAAVGRFVRRAHVCFRLLPQQ